MPLVFSSVFPLCDIATFTSDQSVSHAAQGDKSFWPTQEGWLLRWGRGVVAGVLFADSLARSDYTHSRKCPRPQISRWTTLFPFLTGRMDTFDLNKEWSFVREAGWARSLVFLSRIKTVSFRHYFHGVVSFCHDLSMDSTRGSWAHMGRLRYF